MGDYSDTFGRGLFVGCCIGAAIFLLANGLDCAPSECTYFWLGETGFIGALVGVGTLLAVIAAGVSAWKSYATTLETNAATRFQKAVELMGSENNSSATGGIWSLSDIIRQFPYRYLSPGIHCLLSLIRERSSSFWLDFARFDPEFMGRSDIETTSGNEAAAQAFIACANIPYEHRWPEDIHIDGTVDIFGLVLVSEHYDSLDYRSYDISESILDDVIFTKCNFAGCKLQFRLGTEVKFVGCDLTDTRLEPSGLDGAVPEHPWAEEMLSFENCKTEGATVNGRTLAEHVAYIGPRHVQL